MGKKIGYFSLSVAVFVAGLVIMLVAQFAVAIPAMFMASFEAGMQGIEDANVIMEMSEKALYDSLPYCLLVSHIALIVVFSIWYYFGCGRPSLKKVKFKEIFTPKYLAGTVLVGVGICFFTIYALELLTPYIPEKIMQSYNDLMEQSQMSVNAVSITAAVFLAPFGEEFLFRGVVFHYCKKAVEDMNHKTAAFWIANIVQAFFFGFMHLNLVQGTYAFVAGLVLGYLAYRFKSILPGILVHMLNNGISVFGEDTIIQTLPDGAGFMLVIVLVSLAVLAAGIVLTGKKKEV